MKFTVTDGYAPGANPRRGYHASVCTITFENEHKFDQWAEAYQGRVATALRALFDGDMWCHPPKMIAPNIWEIHHGYDSGD